MSRVVIIQPSYLPWLGYFEQISQCDIFVYLDDVQFTKNDWRNRNRIKTKDGINWVTVPVQHKFKQEIRDTLIDTKHSWQKKHMQTLKTWYGKSRFFKDFISELAKIYSKDWKYLVDIDIEITSWLIDTLGIHCEILRSSELNISSADRQLRLIEMCSNLKCDSFYEGKSGQYYIDTELFKNNGIHIAFQDYKHPYYNQLWIKEQGFISHLSIIDLLFNHGPESLAVLTGKKIIQGQESVPVRHADEVKPASK
jgi:hypothetical protein